MDLTGHRYGKLTVVSMAGRMSSGITSWNCVCDCGKTCIRGRKTLRKYEHSSCGCGTNEASWETRREKYGDYAKTRLPEYKIWQHIRRRCHPKTGHKHYGKRGITVCDRWSESFENFIEDMGRRPSEKYSIDRIDVNGNYDQSNCRWTTWEVQCRNKRVFNKLGAPGVYWDKQRSKYRVIMSVNGKSVTVGRYDSVEEAVKAREDAEIKYWGKSS